MIEVPTALTPREKALLTRVARGQLVYEAGALLGASTIALAWEAKLVVSVDPHDGYPRRDPSPTWEQYARNLAAAGVGGRVQPVRATFADAPPLASYGVAFADLTGEYDLTAEFLRATSHIPMVAVHDYQRAHCDGATRAVDEAIRRNRPHHVERIDSLIVMVK